jgi:hypothetical protein
MRNVPDDWDSHWTTCPDCGKRYHLSEWCEYCEEIEEEEEDNDQDSEE